MKDYYDELRVEQEKKIDEAIKIAGLSIITPISKNEEVVSNSTKIKTVLEMIPSDEDDFKKQLISKGHAKVTLEYNDGSVRYRDWNCSNITMDSNIRSNIQSTTYWRKRISEGLVKVTVEIK